jgi:hypothetical protein
MNFKDYLTENIKVYSYGSEKVIVDNGKVIHSDTPYCEIGKKPNMDFLRRTGWKLEKTPKQYFSTGETSGNRFLK